MAGRVKADQDTRGSKVGQTPVPSRRGPGPVIGGHEGFFGGAEAPGVGDADRQPDDVEEEVQKDDHRREVEDPTEVFRCRELDACPMWYY